ncbi:MAG: oligosaccharide flippase family protein [Candidatus Omnitrophota bacterium]
MGVLARNAYYNWLGFVVNLVITLLVTPFIIHSLGTNLYGIWALTISITGYFGLLNFGVYNSVVKYISEYKAKNDYIQVSHVASACFTFFAFIGLLVFVLSIPLSLNFTRLFKAASSYHNCALVVFFVLFQLALEFPFRVFRSILSGMQRYDVTNVIFIITAVVRTLLMVIALKMGYALLSLILIGFITNIIPYASIYLYVRRKFPQVHIRFCMPPQQTIKMLFSYSVLVFVISIATTVINSSSAILAAALISAEAVAYFAIASRFIGYLYTLVQTGVEVLTPAISELEAKGEVDKIRDIFYYTTEMLLLLTLPLGVFAIFLGRPFFNLWLGEKFIISFYLLIILMVPQVFSLGLQSACAVMFGMARLKFLTWAKIIEAVMVVVLSIALVKPFGIKGIAFGLSIPVLLIEGVAVFIYTLIFLKISLFKFLKKSLFLPLAASIILSGLLVLCNRYMRTYNWYSFAGEMFFGLLLYIFSVAVLSPKDHKAKVIFRSFVSSFLRAKNTPR